MNRVLLRARDGTAVPMNLNGWLGAPTAEDEDLLERVEGPVLDVGCGPGRHVLALTARGVVAMGVDASPQAVQIAVGRGVPVLRRSVFDPLPGTGRWGTVLVLDGSIGIGGDPAALIGRARDLLRRGGSVIVEIDPPGTASRTLTARLETDEGYSEWFPWAMVAIDALPGLAGRCGLELTGSWSNGGRWFASLAKL